MERGAAAEKLTAEDISPGKRIFQAFSIKVGIVAALWLEADIDQKIDVGLLDRTSKVF